MVACLFMGVSLSRNADQQNRLFCFLKDHCFCFFRAHSRLFGSQSRLQINFSSDYGLQTKGTKKCYRTYGMCLCFRHDYRILELRVICRGTRSALICKSSVYFHAPHFVCSGNGTRKIVILKTKSMPVSINAAANCNEHIRYCMI